MSWGNHIYIVYGHTSTDYEYDNYWNVVAFHDKPEAERYAARLNAWCAEKKLCRRDEVKDGRAKWDGEPHPMDRAFQCGASGTEYGVEEVELW